MALAALVARLRDAGGERLIDVQWRTEHLARLGAVELPRRRYLECLRQALEQPTPSGLTAGSIPPKSG